MSPSFAGDVTWQDVSRRRIYRRIEAMQIEIALLRINLALRTFDPNLPRVPAGRSDRGQWTFDDTARVSNGNGDARLIFVSDGSDDRGKLDLRAEERRGGHIVARHIGKSDDEMFARLEKMRVRIWLVDFGEKRNGSFANLSDANDLVNDTLKANYSIVESVASGSIKKAWVTKRFDHKTGREAYSTDDGILSVRNTNIVGVRIIHNPNLARGFYVRTAYPFLREIGMSTNIEFDQFAGQFFVGILDEINTEEDLIKMTLQPFTSSSSRTKLRTYLDEITNDRFSGEDLRKLWWASPADTVFHDGEQLRSFLRAVRDQL